MERNILVLLINSSVCGEKDRSKWVVLYDCWWATLVKHRVEGRPRSG